MKQWGILALAMIGGYTVLQWWQHKRASGAGQNAHNEQAGVVAGISGQGDYWADPMTAGIPVFNDGAVLNRPDQLAATRHTNDMATVPGGPVYSPAFGPDVNRGGLDTF